MKLKLRKKYLPRLYEPSSYAPRSYEPSSYESRSITHRSEPISYEPKEPITPRYQPNVSQVSLSQPEPIRISALYQNSRFSQVHPSQLNPIPSRPTPVTPDTSQFLISQPTLTISLIHKDDVKEEIHMTDLKLADLVDT